MKDKVNFKCFEPDEVLHFVKSFLCVYEMIVWSVSVSLLMWCDVYWVPYVGWLWTFKFVHLQ